MYYTSAYRLNKLIFLEKEALFSYDPDPGESKAQNEVKYYFLTYGSDITFNQWQNGFI